MSAHAAACESPQPTSPHLSSRLKKRFAWPARHQPRYSATPAGSRSIARPSTASHSSSGTLASAARATNAFCLAGRRASDMPSARGSLAQISEAAASASAASASAASASAASASGGVSLIFGESPRRDARVARSISSPPSAARRPLRAPRWLCGGDPAGRGHRGIASRTSYDTLLDLLEVVLDLGGGEHLEGAVGADDADLDVGVVHRALEALLEREQRGVHRVCFVTASRGRSWR